MRRKGKKLTLVARLWALGQIHTPDPDHADAPTNASQAGGTADALAAFGLVAEEPLPAAPATRKACLWPENLPVYRLWQACQTQWRDGMGGRSGLDYAGVAVVMRKRFGLHGKQEQEQFALLQAMEIAALNAWASQKDAT